MKMADCGNDGQAQTVPGEAAAPIEPVKSGDDCYFYFRTRRLTSGEDESNDAGE